MQKFQLLTHQHLPKQQQIHYLELETDYLRKEAKKASAEACEIQEEEARAEMARMRREDMEETKKYRELLAANKRNREARWAAEAGPATAGALASAMPKESR